MRYDPGDQDWDDDTDPGFSLEDAEADTPSRTDPIVQVVSDGLRLADEVNIRIAGYETESRGEALRCIRDINDLRRKYDGQ